MPKEEFIKIQPDFHKEQENKLPQGELRLASAELMEVFNNRFKNSVMNEGGKVIFPKELIHIPLHQPRWSVDMPQEDKAEIRRITEKYWHGDILEQETSETVTISTGNLPLVRYEFSSKNHTGKNPKITSGRYENTRSAVTKSEQFIKAIPQMIKSQKASI